MARNDEPAALKDKIELAKKMSAGIEKDGASIPITMMSKAQMDAAIATATTVDGNFGAARQTLKDAYEVYIPAADGVRDILITARPVFVSNFGNRWSADWAAVGWAGPSTAVPKTSGARLSLLNSVVNFLAANPSYEVEKTGVTGANAADIYNFAVFSWNDVIDAKKGMQAAGEARTPAETALVGCMRTLMKNLSGKLSPNDARWIDFGVNKPGSKVAPAKPTGLAAEMNVTTGGVVLTCDAQPFAERFRFRGRVAGSGLQFQLLARATGPTGRTKPIPSGTTMEFTVQAVNGGAQSVPSDSIFFTIPMPSAIGVTVQALPAAKQRLKDLMLTDNGLEPMSVVTSEGKAVGEAGLASSRS